MLWLAISWLAILGASMATLVLVITLLLWPQYTQVARYDRLADLVPLATLHVGLVILIASVLNFLGLGIIVLPSWGGMVSSGLELVVSDQGWWISFFPSLLILITVCSSVLLSKLLGKTGGLNSPRPL